MNVGPVSVIFHVYFSLVAESRMCWSAVVCSLYRAQRCRSLRFTYLVCNQGRVFPTYWRCFRHFPRVLLSGVVFALYIHSWYAVKGKCSQPTKKRKRKTSCACTAHRSTSSRASIHEPDVRTVKIAAGRPNPEHYQRNGTFWWLTSGVLTLAK